jgi:glutaminyl-peptide cyclotransferase
VRPILMVIMVSSMVLAGCMGPTQPPAEVPVESDFDGDAAMKWVNDIVFIENETLRPRHPQRSEPQETVDWLADKMEFAGWTVQQDPFTGAQYLELDHGAVAAYGEGSRSCSDEELAQLDEFQFTNLYATRSVDNSTGHVVLAAHWDAKEEAHSGEGAIPAANDGASGMAVLLQLQRHLDAEQLDLPFDLTIAFFDGEDGFEDCHPLAGSVWAARQASLGNVSQLVILDMVGDENARFIRESQSVESDGRLVDAIWNHAATTELADNFVSTRRAIVDDHVPFIEEGIQAVDIIDAGRANTFPPYWHTHDDTPDKLSADMLGHMGDLMVWLLSDPDTQRLLVD